MFGKLFAGLVMGILVGILAFTIVSMGSGSKAMDGAGWSALAMGALTMFLAARAERAKYAWGRGLLLCGVLCFALPLAAMIGSGVVAADSMSSVAAKSDAEKAGTAVGSALGGAAITMMAGVVGLFLGLIFLVGSYFSLRTR